MQTLSCFRPFLYLCRMKRQKRPYFLFGLAIIIALNLLANIFFFRIDLTADKRNSISAPTKQLMRNLSQPLSITIYLDGDLNAGFVRLQKAVAELLDELDMYAGQRIDYQFINPSEADDAQQRQQQYETLIAKGMSPTVIYEKDKEGKSMQRIVFPWAEIRYGNKTRNLCLLKNIRGYSGDENLNMSIESLEYEMTDAIRVLMQTKVQKIAFIEGHGELPEANTYDISLAWSRYFQIDRGVLGNDASVLDGYKAIVIAAPQSALSESDKYIIDQYIMYGGRVMWLLDGVKFDMQALSQTGVSPAMPLDLNLTDMLFRYGIRINPVLLQDEQCLPVPVNVAPESSPADFQPMPWYFAPLLLTSPAHPVSRNIAPISSTFVSCIDFVGNNPQQNSAVLLASSNATHVIQTPATINITETTPTENYFNTGYIPVAGAIEGCFESAFTHRLMPQNIVNAKPKRTESVPTRQIVIASGSIIRNELEKGEALPVGYDRYTQNQFGNRDFLANALLYLTDDEGWINLRGKNFTLRLLNQNISRQKKGTVQWINIGLPIICLLGFGTGFSIYRKRRYTHDLDKA